MPITTSPTCRHAAGFFRLLPSWFARSSRNLPSALVAGLVLFTAALPAPAAVPPGKATHRSADGVPEGLAKSDWQSIRTAYDTGRHSFQQVADGWQARNPGQDWITHFDHRGFTARPQEGTWTWGLQFESYGFGEQQTTVSGPPAVRADGQRLSYQWNTTVQEWFVNDQRGLEHGFTIAERPAAPSMEGLLSFTLSTRGTLSPQVGAQIVTFHDAAGATVLNYSGLKVWDADGTILSSHFEPAGEKSFRLMVDERSARYPITIDPIAQQAYLKASNTEGGDSFGRSVAISGDTVVVGAPNEGSSATGVNGNQADNSALYSGAVYIFTRSGSNWSQQAYLKASNTGANDYFGDSVAVSGDTVVVGAYDEDSNATGVNGNQTDNSAGASGAAYVFIRSGSTWSQQAYLKSSSAGGSKYFGDSVAVSGETVVVGASLEDNWFGAAYVFTRSGSAWNQQACLKASNAEILDGFGASVAVSGDTVVVGAHSEDSNATGVNGNQSDNSASYSGAAYVFTRSGSTWSQQAYLKAGNTDANDYFGESVAVSGDTVVVGAYQESSNATGVNGNQADNSVTNSGAAYVFTRSGGNWSQQAYLKASNTGYGDHFGRSVAISGETVVVGAYNEGSRATGVNGNQGNNGSAVGAAYVFTRSGSTWSQQGYLKASNSGEYDYFGYSVAVSGDTVVAGAYGESSNATGVNGIQTDDSENSSGAVYIFKITTPVFLSSPWTGDADSGIGAGTLWARRFGSTTAATINGVALTGSLTTVSSPEFDLSGTSLYYTIDDVNDLTSLTGQGSGLVAKRFAYNGNPATLTFKQLLPGYTYTVSIFTVGFDTTPNIRVQTFASGPHSQSVDPNAYGDNAGHRIDYTFTADAPTRMVTITPPSANYTLALYAVALRLESVVTLVNTASASGASSALGAPFDRAAIHCTDNSGLSSGLHGITADGTMWLTKGNFQAPNDPLPAEITFDMGSAVDLHSIHVWNYNEGGSFSTRGCKNVTISVAASAGGPFTDAGSYVFAQAPGTASYAGERVPFRRAGVRFLKMTINSNWGDPDQFAGLSEVKFYRVLSAPVVPPDFNLVRNGGNFDTPFTSLPDLIYTLWQSDNLQDWNNSGQPAITGNGRAKFFTIPLPNASVPKRYYRLQVE